jgi:hypothetical protein
VVAVDDKDKATAVWSGQIGLHATLDEPSGNERWTEVAPPARSLRLMLVVDVRGPRRRHP